MPAILQKLFFSMYNGKDNFLGYGGRCCLASADMEGELWATKYIFVTGGVVSGLGKGITAASLGRLLKTRGLKVASQKLDPTSTLTRAR